MIRDQVRAEFELEKEECLLREKERVQLADSDSIQLKLKEMGAEIAPTMLELYIKKQERVRSILQQIDYSVNNNQFAAAVAALCDPKSRRQFISVPSGKITRSCA